MKQRQRDGNTGTSRVRVKYKNNDNEKRRNGEAEHIQSPRSDRKSLRCHEPMPQNLLHKER